MVISEKYLRNMYGYQCEIPYVWLPVRNTLCMVTSAKYLMYGYQCEIPVCMVTSEKYLYVWLSVRNTLCMVISEKYLMYGYQ